MFSWNNWLWCVSRLFGCLRIFLRWVIWKWLVMFGWIRVVVFWKLRLGLLMFCLIVSWWCCRLY